MQYVLVYSPRALSNLRSVHGYLKRRFSLSGADSFELRIRAKCEGIRQAPFQGTLRDDLRPGVRTVGMTHQVTVAWTVEGNLVRILSISHNGKRYASDFSR